MALIPSLVRQRRVLPFVALALIFGVASVLHLNYVSRQRKYLTERNFRVLGSIAHQIENQIVKVTDVIRSVAHSATVVGGFLPARDDTERQSSASGMQQSVRFSYYDPKIVQDYVQDYAERQKTSTGKEQKEQIAHLTEHLKSVPQLCGTSVAANEETANSPPAAQEQQVLLELSECEGEPSIRLLYHLAGLRASVDTKIPFRYLVAPIEQGDLFDGLMVAREDGGSVYINFHERENVSGADLLVDTGGARVDLEYLSTHANQALSILHGTVYSLFAHPFSLPYPSMQDPTEGSPKGARQRLILSGVRRLKSFDADARHVPYTALIIFVFLLSVCALSWPFFRMLNLGPSEALQPRALVALIYSTLLVFSLTNLFLLDGYFSLKLNGYWDDELDQIARRIETNLTAELQSIDGQLDRFEDSQKHPRFGKDVESLLSG